MTPHGPRQSTGRRVLIAGNYGFGNVGDEALLAGCLDVLRQLRPKVEPSVVSGDPAATAALHRVRSYPWHDLRALASAVEECDLVVLGGGGLFHDYWGFEPERIFTDDQGHLARYFRLPLLATAADKPLALLALGIGPLLYDEARRHTRLAFEQATSASVRDAASRTLLAEIGVEPRGVRVTADPAFALARPSAADIEMARRQIPLATDGGARLAIAVRPWTLGPPPESWMAAVAGGIDRLLDEVEGQAVFLPFQSKTAGDRDVARAIRGRMRHSARAVVADAKLTPRELLAQVAAADLVLAMRLHSLIFAIRTGTPALALSYDPKVSALLAEAEMPWLGVELDSLERDALAERLGEVWQRRQEIGARFLERGEPLARRARRGIEAVAALLEDEAERRPRERSARLQELVARIASHPARVQAPDPRPPVEPPGPRDIVCFSIVNWEFRWQRPQQMMALWGRRGHRVFYLRINDLLPLGARPFAVEPVDENVWEVRLALPGGFSVYSGEPPDGFVRAGLESLRALRKELGIRHAAAVIQIAGWTPLARAAREAFGWPLIYDCMDDWSTFPGMAERPAMLALENELAATADLMVVSSRTTQQRWADRRPSALLARNAADFDFLHEAAGDDPLPDVEGPVAGFFGGIAEWFDVELVAHAARARPGVNFVLVGGVHRISVEALERLPNVRLEGLQHYDRIPAYLRRFDACLIPFEISSLTHSVDPVKLYEYLSQGKPVVSTRFHEIVPYGELLYLAQDREDFVRQLDRALREDDPAQRARRIEFARQNTWDDRLDRIEAAMGAVWSTPSPTERISSLESDVGSWRADAEALREELARWRGSRLWRLASVYWRGRRLLGRLTGRSPAAESPPPPGDEPGRAGSR